MKKLLYLLPLFLSSCSGAGFSGGNVLIPSGMLVGAVALIVFGTGKKKQNSRIAAIVSLCLIVGALIIAYLMNRDN